MRTSCRSNQTLRAHQANLRSGTSLTEYALLLSIIACSALFGARLISGSDIWKFDRLTGNLNSPANGPTAGAAAQSNTTDVATGETNLAEAAPNSSVAWKYGSLAVLVGLGLVASFGLLKSRRAKQLLDEPEIGEPVAEKAAAERYAIKRQDIYRVLCRNLRNLLTSNVNVGHILSSVPVHVLPTMPAQEMRDLMKAKQFRHLLVCDGDGNLLGVVSDRDVAGDVTGTAADIMTPHPYTVPAATEIRTAISMMLKHRFSSLPVVNGDRLVGILTVTDLVIMLQVTLQLLDKLNAEISAGTLLDPEENADANSSGDKPTSLRAVMAVD